MDQNEKNSDMTGKGSETGYNSSVCKERSAVIWKRRTGRILISVLAFILVSCIILSLPAMSDFRNGVIRKVAESTVLMHKAKALKADVKELAGDIKAQNVAKAYVSEQKMQKDAASLRETLDKPFWSVSGRLPPVRQEFDDAKELLDILDEADGSIIGPLLPLMQNYPLSELKTEHGVNDTALLEYLRYFESILPVAEDLAVRMEPLDLSRFDSGGSLKKLTDSMDEVAVLLNLAEEADEAVISPLIKIMEEYPLSEIKNDSGLNDVALLEYVKLLNESVPEAKRLADNIGSLNLSDLEKFDAAARIAASLDDAISLLDIVEYANKNIVSPLIPVMEEYPLSSLKSEGGVNVRAILKYLDLFEGILPAANEFSARIKVQDLSWVDRNGSFAGYIAKMDKYLDLGNEVAPRLPVFKGILGNGGDRLYLLVAQNTSELRSSGGFPGKVGRIYIKDGLLTVSDFDSAWGAFSDSVSRETGVSSVEYALFTGAFRHPRDASYCPDFERVAYIWTKNCRGADPDGVISVTPVLIEKLLKIMGSIELSDGTVLTGDNVVRVLGYDFYFGYFSKDSDYSIYEANLVTDALYFEAADKLFNMVMTEFKLSDLPDYYSVFLEGINDRSLQIWMADKDVQKLIRDEGWNSGLNKDKNDPEIAVFFNSYGGAKDTWFLDIDTKLSDPVINSDGTRSYTFTVTFKNTMPDDIKNKATSYLTGEKEGMSGFILIFAPSGGKISDIHTDPHHMIYQYTYKGLEVASTYLLRIKNTSPFKFRCTVTTARGVDAVPTVRIPVLMTDYR